ncbi:MAG: NtaA/DmoA family FMN-dependent monooxygenase [Cellulomonas sp.]|jgi:FMN-dependent oxidoreductase (nitrilotriacetate monooxygenase family)|nr:NtaA/DmoA family FMN-dependent monooxygenase [Cellulomonas sp.]
MSRPFIYNAFVNLSPSHHSHGFWRTEEGSLTFHYQDLDYWVKTAQKLEAGRFDAIFFTSGSGLFDTYQGSQKPTIRNAVQWPQLDPSTIIAALAYHTTDLGFAVTSNVIQIHPFEFARRIATLDQISGGRIGWNIVTAFEDNAGRNYGLEGLPPHDERYRWADEYVDVVYKLLEGSWDDGAVIHDVAAGAYYDANRIHPVDHVGERYRVEGPHIVEPTPQRVPVLFQAGSSDVGRDFAARNAEATFLPSTTPEQAATDLADVQARAVKHGRRAADVGAVVRLSPVVGSTEEEAKRKWQHFRDNLSYEGLAVFHSGAYGIDFSQYGPDTKLKELGYGNGIQGTVRAFVEANPSITLDEVLRESWSGRTVGTPEQIADEIATWQGSGIAGFNVVPLTSLGWDDFVDHVTPVLQARGLQQREYEPGTLRHKLFRQGDRLPESHPAARYRGAFLTTDAEAQLALRGA